MWRSRRYSFFSRRGFIPVLVALLAQVHFAFAHTVSVGYENAGAGAVTFWYGTYHGGTNFTEGSLQLVGPGINTTVGFTSVVQTKPGGLIDGTTNFYSNGTVLVGSFAASAYVGSGMPVAWQGVTFSGLTPGTYTFTYIPISLPTATWQPIDNVILSSSVTLSAMVLSGGTLAPSATNTNQSNAATAIDNALAGGATNTNFSNLSNLTGGALTTALTELTGENGTGAQQAGFQIMNPFLVLVLDPFIESRLETGDDFGPALGYAPQIPTPAAQAYAAVMPKPRSEVDRRWSIWSSSYGGNNRTGGDGAIGSHDSNITAYGTAVGVDYRVRPGTVVGLAMGAGSTSWGLSDGLGGGRSDVFQFGIYGSTRAGPAYVSAAVAYAWHRMSTNRTITFSGDSLAADFDAHSVGGRLEGGYRFAWPAFGITPYAAVQAQAFSTPGYGEYATAGAPTFALNYASRAATDVRSELGAWFDRRIAIDDGRQLLLRARAAWAHDWVSDDSTNVSFGALPTASFIVNGAGQPKDTALASLSGQLKLASGLSFGARLDGEFAEHSTTYVATGNLRYEW